jgi:hypothetical protein
MAKTQTELKGGPADDGTDSAVKVAEATHGMDLKEREFDHKKELDYAGLRMKAQDQQVKQQQAAQAQAQERVVARQQEAKAASKGKVSFHQP